MGSGCERAYDFGEHRFDIEDKGSLFLVTTHSELDRTLNYLSTGQSLQMSRLELSWNRERASGNILPSLDIAPASQTID